MPPPRRRQASLAAEKVNKQIAEQALQDADSNSEEDGAADSSPLNVLGSSPTPGSGGARKQATGQRVMGQLQMMRGGAQAGQMGVSSNMGMGRQGQMGGADHRLGMTLTEQVRMMHEKGLDPIALMAGRSGGMDGLRQLGDAYMNSVLSKLEMRGQRQMAGSSNVGLGGMPNKLGGQVQMGDSPSTTNASAYQTQGNPMQNGGSLPMAMNNGYTPSNSTPNGTIQKRSVSNYLENAPDVQQEERMHKRPAQRLWVVSAPPGPVRNPLNNNGFLPPLYKPIYKKNFDDPDVQRLSGPEFTRGPQDCSLALLEDMLGANNEGLLELEELEAPEFPGLPHYPPPKEVFGFVPEAPKPDILANLRMHLQSLDENNDGELREGYTEVQRLKSTLMKVMGSQIKGIEGRQKSPLPESLFEARQPNFNLAMIALAKIQLATKRRRDPPLFADGVWHNNDRRMEDEDSQLCSFHVFGCDYGVSDERVLLPAEASGGYCRECHEKTIESYEDWQLSLDVKISETGLFSHADGDKIRELNLICATPPLKELGDNLAYRQTASQHQMSSQPRKRPQPSPLDLSAVGNADQYRQQVMVAFNTSGNPVSPMLPRNGNLNPQISQARTSPGIDPQRQPQSTASHSENGVNQSPKMGATGTSSAMATMIGSLGPDQQQFMLKNLDGAGRDQMIPLLSPQLMNAEASGFDHQRSLSNGNMSSFPQLSPRMVSSEMNGNNHQRRISNGNMSPMIATGPLTSPQMMNGLANGINHQRRFSNGNMSPAMGGPSFASPQMMNGGVNALNHQRRLSNGTIPFPELPPDMIVNESGAAIFPHSEIATGGHQRRPSYTGLPPPSPPTAVNFGAFLNGQQNSPGPGGYPVPNYPHTEIATRGHQRRSSYTGLPPPSPRLMIMGGMQSPRDPDGNPMMGSMRNNGHQRSWSNSTISAPSPMMLFDEGRTLRASQNGFPVNGSSGSPLMQSPMLNGGSVWNGNNQRRISNDSAPLSSAQCTAHESIPNAEQADGLATLLRSSLNGGNIQSNGASRPSVANLQAHNVVVETAVATCKQGRVDSSTGDPEAPQTPENRGKPVQVITLTRSGRTIGPTTMAATQASSKNTIAKAKANGSCGSPVKATIAQRRNSKGQEDMHIVNMPPSRLKMTGREENGPYPRGRLPPFPANPHAVGLGISNIEESEGHTGRERLITASEKSLTNGAEALMIPPQATAQKVPSPHGPLPTSGNSSSLASNRGPGSFAPSISADRTTLSASSSFPPFPASTTPGLNSSPQAPAHAAVLRHANTNPLPSSGTMGPPPRPGLHRSASLPRGPMPGPAKPLLFCRGSPWRQVDVNKARICEDCKEEKLAIISHKHVEFFPLSENRGIYFDDREGVRAGVGWGMLADTQRKTCMVCTGLATSECKGCPLKVCTGCEVVLRKLCKGSITNLVIHHESTRTHVRNDAFLLRGDGFGF